MRFLKTSQPFGSSLDPQLPSKWIVPPTLGASFFRSLSFTAFWCPQKVKPFAEGLTATKTLVANIKFEILLANPLRKILWGWFVSALLGHLAPRSAGHPGRLRHFRRRSKGARTFWNLHPPSPPLTPCLEFTHSLSSVSDFRVFWPGPF